jgi:hypothetical protein
MACLAEVLPSQGKHGQVVIKMRKKSIYVSSAGCLLGEMSPEHGCKL